MILWVLVLATAGLHAQACGDCNGDGSQTILDALKGAQIAVSLVVPTPADALACDVDADSDIDIIDALVLAQVAAGQLVTLSCPFPPTITGVVVVTGPTAGTALLTPSGAETVEVSGTDFFAGSEVSLDGAPVATNFASSTLLTFVAPAWVGEATVDVTVTNPGGLVTTLPDSLSYTLELSLDPYAGLFTRAQAHHLYRRAAWGGTPTEIDTALIVGLTATTAALVNYTNDTAIETAAEAVYAGSLPPRPDLNTRTNKEWWLYMIAANSNPFQDRLAWLLHDHFAISERAMSDDFRYTMYGYVNLMRRFSMSTGDSLANGEPGLGYDWKGMVIEMSKDRAMLDWLDGRVSTRTSPNENYARELWELFTLGEGNGYTEDDIREAAKAFTGFFWYRVGGSGTNTALEMRYQPGRHDAGLKTILGATGHYGYDDIAPFYETMAGPSGFPELGTTDPMILSDPVDVDGGVVELTFTQRPVEVSRFITFKLCEYFLYDNPSDLVIDELAADLRAPGPNQWNLQPVILKILRSEAFFSQRAIKGKYKSPMDFLLGFLRSTAIELEAAPLLNAQRLRERLEAMEQVVLDPPDVSGWPLGSPWITSQGMLQRYNFLDYSIDRVDTVAECEALLATPRASMTATSMVDDIAGLLDVELSSSAQTRCELYTNRRMVGGSVATYPFDPADDTSLLMKTRGLFWIIAQYHDYHQE